LPKAWNGEVCFMKKSLMIAFLLFAFVIPTPAWAQGSCPQIGQTWSYPCSDGQGCIQYYDTKECWGYGVPAGGNTCGCPGYTTCCGQQTPCTPVGICYPGSQCAGACGDPRATRVASTHAQTKPKAASQWLLGKGVSLASLADACVQPTAWKSRK
jgi:hypothetical protein